MPTTAATTTSPGFPACCRRCRVAFRSTPAHPDHDHAGERQRVRGTLVPVAR
jgi:hypothetical protein